MTRSRESSRVYKYVSETPIEINDKLYSRIQTKKCREGRKSRPEICSGGTQIGEYPSVGEFGAAMSQKHACAKVMCMLVHVTKYLFHLPGQRHLYKLMARTTIDMFSSHLPSRIQHTTVQDKFFYLHRDPVLFQNLVQSIKQVEKVKKRLDTSISTSSRFYIGGSTIFTSTYIDFSKCPRHSECTLFYQSLLKTCLDARIYRQISLLYGVCKKELLEWYNFVSLAYEKHDHDILCLPNKLFARPSETTLGKIFSYTHIWKIIKEFATLNSTRYTWKRLSWKYTTKHRLQSIKNEMKVDDATFDFNFGDSLRRAKKGKDRTISFRFREVDDIDIYYCDRKEQKDEFVEGVLRMCQDMKYRKTTHTIEIVVCQVHVQFVRYIFSDLRELMEACTFPLVGMYYNPYQGVLGTASALSSLLDIADNEKIRNNLHPAQVNKYIDKGLLQAPAPILSRQEKAEPFTEIKLHRNKLFATEEKIMSKLSVQDDLLFYESPFGEFEAWPLP